MRAKISVIAVLSVLLLVAITFIANNNFYFIKIGSDFKICLYNSANCTAEGTCCSATDCVSDLCGICENGWKYDDMTNSYYCLDDYGLAIDWCDIGCLECITPTN